MQVRDVLYNFIVRVFMHLDQRPSYNGITNYFESVKYDSKSLFEFRAPGSKARCPFVVTRRPSSASETSVIIWRPLIQNHWMGYIVPLKDMLFSVRSWTKSTVTKGRVLL